MISRALSPLPEHEDEADRFPLTILKVDGERRSRPRFRFAAPARATLGKRTVSLMDISARGARIRHANPVSPGGDFRLRFDYHGLAFEVESRILASRFVSIGTKVPLYESRLNFTSISQEQQEAVEAALEKLSSIREEHRADNLAGRHPQSGHPQAASGDAFTRCRYVGSRWRMEQSKTSEIPDDGFLVPSHIDEGEIRVICAAYEKLDADGRQLLRLFAAAG